MKPRSRVSGNPVGAMKKRLQVARTKYPALKEQTASRYRELVISRTVPQVQDVFSDPTVADEYKIDPALVPEMIKTSKIGSRWFVEIDPKLVQLTQLYEYGSGSLGFSPRPAWRGFMNDVKKILLREMGGQQ